jgi:hypothetical protein
MYFCNFRLWMDCHRAARDLEGHERFLTVRYERLTAEPDTVQAQIADRFPFLERRHDFSRYEQYALPSAASRNALGGLRPIGTDRRRSWEQHLPRLKAELQRHPELAQVLIETGYERDREWLRRLDGVEPREFACRYRDHAFHPKQLETRIRKYFQARAYIARHHLVGGRP